MPTDLPERGTRSAAGLSRLEPVRMVQAGVLDVGYYEAGPGSGPAVLLLHGFPYDIHSFAEVIPPLAQAGLRVIVPYLRGYGPTRLADPAEPRAGQQSALGQDIIDLLGALGIDRAILAGFDWGGRAACVAAALWPDRCAGLVSVNGYTIQDIASGAQPVPPDQEHRQWFWFYFGTERGRRGLAANRRALAKVIWAGLSPQWPFDEAIFDRSAGALDNDDFVDVVLHSFRHRIGLAPGYPRYEDLEKRLAAQPPISVPAITLDGVEDGFAPPSDGTAQADLFTGPRSHRQIPHAGHNVPQDAPEAFAAAVLDLTR